MKLLFTGIKNTGIDISVDYTLYLDGVTDHISLENLGADIGKTITEVMILVAISAGLDTAVGRTITVQPSYEGGGQATNFAPLPYETHVLRNLNSKAAIALWLGPYLLYDIPDLRDDFSVTIISDQGGDSSINIQCYTFSRNISDDDGKVHASDIDAVGGESPITIAEINTECDAALTDYDPPTRAEATTDKDAIITEVDANETKIDGVKTKTDGLNFTGTSVNSDVQKVLGATPISKADINAECDSALSDYDPPTRTEATSDKDEIISEVDDNEELLRADKKIDTDKTPWVVDHNQEGTSNALMSKTMKNTAGENITAVENVLGQLEQE